MSAAPSRTDKSLIDRLYPETNLDRDASWCIQRALDIPLHGRLRGAHLGCGSGYITQNWPGQRTCSWHGIDPDAELIATAKSRPFASRNYWEAFVAAGGLSSAATAPLRLDYSFRSAPLHATGIRAKSVDRIVIEWGHREFGEADLICDEIERIGRPDAIVCFVCYHPLDFDAWAISDVVHPILCRARLARRQRLQAFERFGLRQLDAGEKFYATARWDLADAARHLDASPELVEKETGFFSYSLSHTPLRGLWGQPRILRNVRRRVTVWVGSLPASSAEHADACP